MCVPLVLKCSHFWDPRACVSVTMNELLRLLHLHQPPIEIKFSLPSSSIKKRRPTNPHIYSCSNLPRRINSKEEVRVPNQPNPCKRRILPNSLRRREQLCRRIRGVNTGGESHITDFVVVLPRHAVARDLIDDLDIVRDGLGTIVLRAMQAERGTVAAAYEEGIGAVVVAFRKHWSSWPAPCTKYSIIRALFRY